MKVGIIAPVSMLDEYCTTNIQYCLPKLLVENERYRDFYKKRKKQKNIIIIDSRRVGTWKREPEEYSIIVKALDILRPDYFILPSWMFNQKRTIAEVKRFIGNLLPVPNNLVACLEGTNEKEIVMLRKLLSKDLTIKSFALPEHIQTFCKTVECDNSIIYIENHLRVEELNGLDGILITSLPVRLGLQGRLLSDYLPGPPSLTFHENEDRFPKVIERNIKELLEYYEVQKGE